MFKLIDSVVSDPDKLKRLLMTLLAASVPVLNEKFGWHLNVESLIGVIVPLVVFVWQSGNHSALVNAAKAGQDASDKVMTEDDVLAVFKKLQDKQKAEATDAEVKPAEVKP